jgi:uncharacterized cupin superfamily protein
MRLQVQSIRWRTMTRSPYIKHWRELQSDDDAHYPGSDERLSIGSPFGRAFGFKRVAIHHEVLPPGRRTSRPHAEKTEDEFIYVIEGAPDVWLDGALHRLQAGDGVGFSAGDGMAHTFINNTQTDVRLLVVGDVNRDDNQIHYPLHPQRNAAPSVRHWADIPARSLGTHDGLPDALHT